ncbi:hypothetical protein ACQE3E_17440 [Methylomonas sp. MED-D]|uniref:hypothetical protein n=1 Tax=unclassified Methylomonas TaxID=2608980 RepID=UPI00247A76FD|nr:MULTISPECIES: hypothetical protein [unclassified Methylomonas]MDT4330860.1 hypothetical protein [Methylomonas sp. MV1]WGS85022.1 hypothetical protein QC632_18495 [Methylomonas sp. UP202]
MSDPDDFYLQVAFALTGCQLVEQALKLYIAEALEYVKKCVGKRLPFKMTGQDYEDASLERLIEAFRKLTDNEELVAALRKFKNERNFLSHKGIAHCLDPTGELGNISVAEVMPRLQAIQTEAQRLRIAIHEEGVTFKGHLYFGSFPE